MTERDRATRKRAKSGKAASASRPDGAALDDDVRQVLNTFRSLVKALRLADRASVTESGLGSAQLFILYRLSEHSPLSVNDLASLTGTDQSTVSVVVNKLVTRGYVSSQRSAADARRAELKLTAKGKTAVRKRATPFQESFVAALESLPDRRLRDLARALHDVVLAMGVDDENPPMLLEEEESGTGRPRKAR